MSANDEASAQAKVHVREEICENTFKTASHNGTIVLIGPTRNGKSTLGNLLVHGADDQDAEPAFAEGDGAESETRKCSVATVTDEAKFEHAILDTPGFGDTNGQDHVLQLHLAESLVALSGAGYGVSLFVMVVRRNNGLGPEYKELIKLYRRLLGKFFEDNLQIVLTGSAERDLERMEKRAQKMVKMGPFGAMDKMRRETCELLGLAEDQVPLMFVDAVPGTEEDKKRATAVRRTLFEKARVTEAWVPTTFDRIPKVPSWVNEDNQYAAKVRGRVDGYLFAITDKKAAGRELVLKREAVAARVFELHRAIGRTEMWLREYDTKVKEQVFLRRDFAISNRAWWPLTRTEGKITIEPTRFPVSSFLASANSKVAVGADRRSVTLTGKSGVFWTTGSVSVALFTSYQEFYGRAIAEAHESHGHLQRECLAAEGQLQSLQRELGATLHDEGSLNQRFLDEHAQLAHLSSSDLPLDKFRERCRASGAKLIPPVDLGALVAQRPS